MFNSNSTSQNFPLSLNLQALYLDILKRPENRAYNYAYVYKIKGILNISLLKKALYKIISKRTTLNTFFLEIGGIPYQSIQKNRSPNFKIIDGTKFPKKKLEALLEKEVSSYFDIYCPPLYKFILIKKEEDLFYLIAKFHHLIMDGTCLEAAFHELSNAYNEPDIIQLKNLTPLEIQDWLKYENSISNEERETSSEFWKKYLANSNINYSLASPSRGKKDRQLHLICKFYFQLSSSLSRMIKDFSQKYNISIFRILLTTYCALLWRYTKEDDITLSYPLNLRREKFEDLFGYYTGKQPFRVQIYENDSFEELLVKVKESLNLCKIILPYVYTMGKQSLSYSNIEFGKSNFLTNALRLKGLQINRIKHNKSYAISDLAFLYDDATQKIEFDVHFNQEKYDDSFIQEFCNHFRVFLERQLQDPKILISTIPFLTENELHKLLIQWNDTKKDHEENVTIHQLFERQVEKTPDKIAIICDDQAITYQELSTRANKLAHYLREKGVNSDTCVAINCKRSIDLIIGILSILKAGGAYVPLDPSYPKERLRYILEDTKAPLIITESHLIDQLSGIDIDIVALETAQKTLESYPETNLSESSQPHNLAYVIYTSGSTGEPKGVLIEHNSICNRLLWLQDDIKLSQEDIYLHQFSFCFDGAVVSLWWPLVYGTTIIVPSSEGLSDGEYLARIISQKSVSTLFCTPSMMNVLLNYSKLHEVQSINKVILGGETFPKKLFEKLQILKGCKLYNFYGPTECSVMSSYYDATSKMIVTPTVPIGRPVANTYIYILDAFRHPPPVGAVGEIYIGGKGLARGYLNRQTLTEERFIFSPFMNDKGEQIRLYRTGDLGRYLPDGNIEHLGRNDDQVKLRGFRIELKEIESHLVTTSRYKRGNCYSFARFRKR
jgi:amino acid adenylation domain-containing protein